MARPRSLSHATSFKDRIAGDYSSANIMQLCRSAMQRSQQKAVPFAGLDALYGHAIAELARNGGVCECCKGSFARHANGKGGGGKQSLSLHRVTAALGYVPENIKVICQGCNNAIGEIQNPADIVKREYALAWQRKIMLGD